MTRRGFFIKITKTAAAIIAGGWLIARKAAPRKFVAAIRHKKYPGIVKPLPNIEKKSKWSG